MKITSANTGQQEEKIDGVGRRVDESLRDKDGKYVVKKDNTFRINLFLVERSGRWVVVRQDVEGAEKHWVEFRMWTFDEEVELRKRATHYDSLKRIHTIDHDQLNRFKVQKLLKCWSFEEQNPNLKLHHSQGILTDESWDAFSRLFPAIIHYIIESMNMVLDYGE